jgi:hypothetical protein
MKQISLSRGFKAMVDDCDYDRIGQYTWSVKQCKGSIYAHRQVYLPHKTTETMHRFVLGLKIGDQEIDHKDGNGLNNTRENLRLATRGQNIANRQPYKNSPLGFKGVKKQKNRYLCRVGPGGTTYVGSFKTLIEASLARDYWAVHLHGEFAQLNPYPKDLAI